MHLSGSHSASTDFPAMGTSLQRNGPFVTCIVIDIFPASLRIVSSLRTHFTTARCFSHWAFLPETRECTMLDGRKPGKD